MWKDSHCLLRTVNRSFWSFLNRPDIRQVFTVVTLDPFGKEYHIKGSSDGFLDAFMDLFLLGWEYRLTTDRFLRILLGRRITETGLLRSRWKYKHFKVWR